MTASAHGPGVTWLAQRAGTTPERLLKDPALLIDALTVAARDGADLVARLGSDDPHQRAGAEAQARAVRARFASMGTTTPTPGERFAATVAQGLRDAAARANARGADGRYSRSDESPTPPENP